jgi:diguanylate cyclase (GGDEF)-like protein
VSAPHAGCPADTAALEAMARTIERLEREKARLRARCARIREDRERAWESASRDALTRLPNRALFEDRLELMLRSAARAGRRFALAYLDLDSFKQVNDRHGHAAGDELLARVGRRLQLVTRDSDTVGRIGGDEFALLLGDLDMPVAVEFLGERIHRVVCAPLVLDATLSGTPAVVRPAASIGIALFPDHADTGAALLKRADASMYAVKRDGGGVRLCDAGPAAQPARTSGVSAASSSTAGNSSRFIGSPSFGDSGAACAPRSGNTAISTPTSSAMNVSTGTSSVSPLARR